MKDMPLSTHEQSHMSAMIQLISSILKLATSSIESAYIQVKKYIWALEDEINFGGTTHYDYI